MGPVQRSDISDLNDRLRSKHEGGMVVLSRGLVALGSKMVGAALAATAEFTRFTPDNDPHGEHDCAVMEVLGHRIMFKIDTYADDTLTWGAEDRSDPRAIRVMTVMLAEEY